MALATLSIDIEAKLAKLQEGMDAAARAVQGSAQRMQGSLDTLGRSASLVTGLLKGAFAGLAGGLAIDGFIGITKGIDALNDFKDATGASIANASALEDVAARTGTAFETVQASVLKLNMVLGDAKPGSTQANTLKAIGLSAEELRRLDPAEALRQVAVALATFDDDGKKARLTMDLFGKSTKEVAPFLADLATQSELVGRVTAEQAAQAEKFNQALDGLKKNSLDAARNLAGALLPALNDMLKAFNDAGGGATGFRKALDALGERTPFSQNFFDTRNLGILRGELKALQDEAAKGPGVLGDLFGGGAKALDEAVAAKQAELNALLKTISDRNRVESRGFAATAASFGSSARPSVPDVPTGGKGVTAKERQSELDKYIERLQVAQIAVFDLSNAEQAELDIAAGKLGQLNEAQKERVRQEARILDVLKPKKTEPVIQGPSIDPQVLKQRQDAQRELNRLLDETASGKFDALVEQTNSLIDAQREGTITSEQYAAGMALLQQRFDELTPKAKAVETAIDKVTDRFQANVQDQLGDSLVDVLEGNFEQIGDNWERLLKRMLAQAAAAQISKYLFQSSTTSTAPSGGTGGTGPAVGSIGAVGDAVVVPNGIDNRASAQSVGGAGRAPNVTVNVSGAPSTPAVQTRTDANGGVQIDLLFEQVRGRLIGDAQQGGPYITTVAQQLGSARTGALVR